MEKLEAARKIRGGEEKKKKARKKLKRLEIERRNRVYAWRKSKSHGSPYLGENIKGALRDRHLEPIPLKLAQTLHDDRASLSQLGTNLSGKVTGMLACGRPS